MLYMIGGEPRTGKTILAQRVADRFGCPYVDMANNFPSRLDEAETLLITGSYREERN